MRYGISILLMFVFFFSCNIERQPDDAKDDNSEPAEKIQGMVLGYNKKQQGSK